MLTHWIHMQLLVGTQWVLRPGRRSELLDLPNQADSLCGSCLVR